MTVIPWHGTAKLIGSLALLGVAGGLFWLSDRRLKANAHGDRLAMGCGMAGMCMLLLVYYQFAF